MWSVCSAPLVSGLSVVSFNLYSAADTPIAPLITEQMQLPRWSTHPCESNLNIKQFYENTAALLKLLSGISSMQ